MLISGGVPTMDKGHTSSHRRQRAPRNALAPAHKFFNQHSNPPAKAGSDSAYARSASNVSSTGLANATMSRRLWGLGRRENDFIEVTSAATVPFNALRGRKPGGGAFSASGAPAQALAQERGESMEVGGHVRVRACGAAYLLHALSCIWASSSSSALSMASRHCEGS